MNEYLALRAYQTATNTTISCYPLHTQSCYLHRTRYQQTCRLYKANSRAGKPRKLSSKQVKYLPQNDQYLLSRSSARHPTRRVTLPLPQGASISPNSYRLSPPLSNYPVESKSSQQWQAKIQRMQDREEAERKQKGRRNREGGMGMMGRREELSERIVGERGRVWRRNDADDEVLRVVARPE